MTIWKFHSSCFSKNIIHLNICFRNFEPKHLGQIKSVYPECYEVRQEKGIIEGGVKSNKYQMTVEPVLEGRQACMLCVCQ